MSRHFVIVSPDDISNDQGVAPMQAGRHAVEQQEEQLRRHQSFVIDTTFSGSRGIRLMHRAKVLGYRVNFVFVGVNSPQLCQARILERIDDGEHSVPPADIFRRYERSLLNLPLAIQQADRAAVFDNTGVRRRLMLSLATHDQIRFASDNPSAWFTRALPNYFDNTMDDAPSF